MSVMSEVENELKALRERAQALEAKIAPEVPKLVSLEGNPVVDSLLAAVHVPPSGLALVIGLIEGLEHIYGPEEPASTPPAEAPVPVGPATVNPPAAPVG